MKQSAITITSPYSLVSKKLKSLLKNKIEEYLQQNSAKKGCESITINFRDTTYSAELGGYYPVEIMLLKQNEGLYQIQYLTDFAYMGNVYPELERNVDFDIANGQAFIAPIGWYQDNDESIKEFYLIWEINFLAYVEMDMFTEIKITDY